MSETGRETGEEFIRRRLLEFGSSVSERSQMLAKGIITGFLPFFLRLLLEPGRATGSPGLGVSLLIIMVIASSVWGMRVYWYSVRSVVYFVLGGLASSVIASYYQSTAWYLMVYFLSLGLAYPLSWLEAYIRFVRRGAPSSSQGTP